MNLDLVILAAGLSTRYGAPKALEPVGPAGERLTDYAIHDAVQAGFSRIVFVVRREHEAAFRDHQAAAFPPALAVEYVFQEGLDWRGDVAAQSQRTRPRGTGHALLCAAPAIKRPFAMINADDFYGRAAFDRLAPHLRASSGRNSSAFAMISYCLRDTLSPTGGVSRAVCRADGNSQLKYLLEYHHLQENDGIISGRPAGAEDDSTFRGDEPVSMNIWGFTPDVFPLLDAAFDRFRNSGRSDGAEFQIGAAIQTMIDSRAACVDVLTGGAGWLGITYPGDRKRVADALAGLVRNRTYPSPLVG